MLLLQLLSVLTRLIGDVLCVVICLRLVMWDAEKGEQTVSTCVVCHTLILCLVSGNQDNVEQRFAK